MPNEMRQALNEISRLGKEIKKQQPHADRVATINKMRGSVEKLKKLSAKSGDRDADIFNLLLNKTLETLDELLEKPAKASIIAATPGSKRTTSRSRKDTRTNYEK